MTAQPCSNRHGEFVRPGCYDGVVTTHLVVVYHDNPFTPSGETSDTLALCEKCAETIASDAGSHGYQTRKEAA